MTYDYKEFCSIAHLLTMSTPPVSPSPSFSYAKHCTTTAVVDFNIPLAVDFNIPLYVAVPDWRIYATLNRRVVAVYDNGHQIPIYKECPYTSGLLHIDVPPGYCAIATGAVRLGSDPVGVVTADLVREAEPEDGSKVVTGLGGSGTYKLDDPIIPGDFEGVGEVYIYEGRIDDENPTFCDVEAGSSFVIKITDYIMSEIGGRLDFNDDLGPEELREILERHLQEDSEIGAGTLLSQITISEEGFAAAREAEHKFRHEPFEKRFMAMLEAALLNTRA